MESKKSEKHRFLRYENGNELLYNQFAGVYRYGIFKADHFSFTDAPLWLACPARFLAVNIFGFGNIPQDTHHATVDIFYAFFINSLSGRSTEIDSVANRYEGIIRMSID